MHMHKKITALVGFLLLQGSAHLFASDLGINVILSSEVRPGVYGQVEIGNMPPPRVVYTRPVRIVADKRYYRAEPVYLNVPPDHSKNWSRHCREYQACGRKVYFVRTREYDSDYQRYERERKYYDHHPRKEYRDERDHRDDKHDRDDRNR